MIPLPGLLKNAGDRRKDWVPELFSPMTSFLSRMRTQNRGPGI